MNVTIHGGHYTLFCHDPRTKNHSQHSHLRPEGGGGIKIVFPVFTYLIGAAGEEQEEKNRTEI